MNKSRLLKWLAILLASLGLLVAAFVFIYAPIRAKNLARRYEQFRQEHQAEHDAIDAQFNQQDTVVNGIKWHYVDEGNPNGEVILFLHGLPEGWYSWRYVLPLIDQDYRLIAIDMKGYGRSDLQDDEYDWHTVARQTVDLMDSLGVFKFYVVSHDWGSIIGSVLVHNHQARMLGFVRMEADLVREAKGAAALLGFLQKPQWLLFQSNWIASYMYQDAGWFIDSVYASRMTTPFREADRDYLVYEYSRPGVAEMNPKYFVPRNWDLDTAIDRICKNEFAFPVLQLQADSDPHQPAESFADIATACTNVEIEWVTDASHFSSFDQPEQVADAINRFVHGSDH